MSTQRRRLPSRRSNGPPARPRGREARPAAASPTGRATSPPERTIPLRERASVARSLGRMQTDARRTRGRPLRPGDDLFPELEGMGDAEVTEAIAHALEREGVAPALVYAFRKTGLLISAESLPFLSAAGRKAWLVALQEFADRQD